MLPRKNLDFQNLRSTILGHSGRSYELLQTPLLEFNIYNKQFWMRVFVISRIIKRVCFRCQTLKFPHPNVVLNAFPPFHISDFRRVNFPQISRLR